MTEGLHNPARSKYWSLKVALSYLAIYVVWGSTYLAISISLETLPMFFLSAVRFTVAGLILVAYALFAGCGAPSRANILVAVKSGFLAFFCSFAMLTWAQLTLPSSVAALLISLEPVWFVIFSWLIFGGSKPTGRVVAALLVGFAGCAMLVFAEPAAEAATGVTQTRYALSALSVVGCGLTWVYGALLSSKSPDSHPHAAMASGLQMLAGGLIFAAVSTLNGDYASLGGASLRSCVALAYLIVFGSVFSYSAYIFLLRTQPAAKVAAHTFVNPIVAVGLGWAIAGEPVTSSILAAGLLIVVSVILITYAKPKHG